MDLTLTVDTPAGAATDLRIRLPDGTPVTRLAGWLRRAVGAAADAPLHRAGRLLPGDGRAVDWELTEGCVVTVGSPTDEPPAAELVALSGPDAGRRWRLPVGDHVIGRGDAAVDVDDAAVSRHHAVVQVRSDRLAVTDLESANGTTLTGRPLPAGRAVAVVAGATLRLGDSQLWIGRPGTLPPPPPPSASDRRRPPVDAEVRFPSPPADPPPVRLPLVAAGAPLFVGAGLAWLLHEWQFLAFTVLSPVMALAQWISDRRARRTAAERARQEFDAATEAAAHRLGALLDAERESHQRGFPDVGTLLASAATGRPARPIRTLRRAWRYGSGGAICRARSGRPAGRRHRRCTTYRSPFRCRRPAPSASSARPTPPARWPGRCCCRPPCATAPTGSQSWCTAPPPARNGTGRGGCRTLRRDAASRAAGCWPSTPTRSRPGCGSCANCRPASRIGGC